MFIVNCITYGPVYDLPSEGIAETQCCLFHYESYKYIHVYHYHYEVIALCAYYFKYALFLIRIRNGMVQQLIL